MSVSQPEIAYRAQTVFYISSLLESVIRRSHHPGVLPFAILLAQLPMSFSCSSFRRRGANPSDGDEERSYTANQFTADIRTRFCPSFWGTDYKFKCKPTWSRGARVRNASSQPRVDATQAGNSPTALANTVMPRTIVIEIALSREARERCWFIMYYIMSSSLLCIKFE